MITIKLNGQEHSLDANASVQALLLSMSLADKPVVVELNKKALFPREYEGTAIADGDQIEIITIAAGG